MLLPFPCSFDEAHPALAGEHCMRSKDEDILLDRALSESSAGMHSLDRRSLAANSLAEVCHLAAVRPIPLCHMKAPSCFID